MCYWAWQPDFLKKYFSSKNQENGKKIEFLKFIGKFSHHFFLYFICNESLYYFLYSCTNTMFGKFCSWDMGHNPLSQSDYSIFNSTVYLEQNDKKAWFFACRYRFMEIKSWLKNIWMGMVKNSCMSRKNEWNKLIVGVLIQIWES